MKKTPTIAEHHNNNQLLLLLIWLALVLCPLLGFSQSANLQAGNEVITLDHVVANIKQKNKSIKNVEKVNVMVNDVLIKDLKDFTLDPKSISMVEVLVLKPQDGDGRQINSIIINTK